jgi:hypothetical protein
VNFDSLGDDALQPLLGWEMTIIKSVIDYRSQNLRPVLR